MGGGLRGVSQCAATCGDGLRSDSEVRDDGANPSTRPNPNPKQARHPDGSKCFTDRSLEFQEKITRTSCISEDSIFPETIFATEKAGYWGKDAEKKVRSHANVEPWTRPWP